MRRREGFSPYNKIFEFEHELDGRPALFLFTSVAGHLIEMEFEEEFRSWSSTQPVRRIGRRPTRHAHRSPLTVPLFCKSQVVLLSREASRIVRSVRADMHPLERTLKREARSCSVLVLWLDCDSEGENIAYEVVSVCHAANPRLDVRRARFSAITARDVQSALRTLGPPDPAVNNMVDARRVRPPPPPQKKKTCLPRSAAAV